MSESFMSLLSFYVRRVLMRNYFRPSKVVDMRSSYMVDIGCNLQRQTGGKSVDIFGYDLIKFLNEFLHLIGWRIEAH